MRIKNVVFDVGGVLLDWKPLELLTDMFDKERALLLKKNMTDSECWSELDRGTLSIQQAIRIFSERIPDLKNEIEFALLHFVDYLPVINENVGILYSLSLDNYRLFVLSNFHSETFSKAYTKYDFFSLFEGLVISSRVKMIKPEKEIYQYMLKEYALDPNETLFFDDSEANIKTAKELNIIGVHTPTPRELKAFVEKNLKKVK